MALKQWEYEIVFMLAENLTGSFQKGQHRKDILASNVERRVFATRCPDLTSYLKLIETNTEEYSEFISAITIHTTSWFRELPHFHFLNNYVSTYFKSSPNTPLKVWSSACSSGEELYSIALCLAEYNKNKLPLGFSLFGTDIDQISIKRAAKAIYSINEFNKIPPQYSPWLLRGSEKLAAYFTLDKDLRSRCTFEVRNLENRIPYQGKEFFDIIFCRNVLIYFSQPKIKEILGNLSACLKPGGVLVLGHSETLFDKKLNFELIEGSVFRKKELKSPNALKAKINTPLTQREQQRVLIIDDSPTIRLTLKKIFQKSDFLFVEAETAEAATLHLKSYHFDLITLDLNLPGENGIQWLTKQRNNRLSIPVIIISDSSPSDAENVFGALQFGAQEYITKSKLSMQPEYLIEVAHELIAKDCQQGSEKVLPNFFKNSNTKLKNRPKCIVIGASTGGPEALSALLENFPKPTPPIIVVQHIHNDFAAPLAKRLAKLSGLNLGGATSGEELLPNTIYLAHQEYHIGVEIRKGQLFLKHDLSEKINGHKPSVDFLFRTLAKLPISKSAVLLTGMGQDGAAGILEIKNSENSYTLAQNETSCVVFGMPKVAIEKGAIDFVANLPKIRSKLIELINLPE
jgi:chemotaxis response regulator CheB/chemotaxis methyl-accepting protein methylase